MPSSSNVPIAGEDVERIWVSDKGRSLSKKTKEARRIPDFRRLPAGFERFHHGIEANTKNSADSVVGCMSPYAPGSTLLMVTPMNPAAASTMRSSRGV